MRRDNDLHARLGDLIDDLVKGVERRGLVLADGLVLERRDVGELAAFLAPGVLPVDPDSDHLGAGRCHARDVRVLIGVRQPR